MSKSNGEQWIWVDEFDVPKNLLEKYLCKQNQATDKSCNTDKTKAFPCEIKCKSRGLVVCASNCGIIESYREIILAESKSQVALFYLDTIDLMRFLYFYFFF
jgi:hypothetical protein